MITLSHQVLRIEKQTPLMISRGARTQAVLCWVRLGCEGVEGWGEASEFSVGDHRETLAEIEAGLRRAARILRPLSAFEREHVEARLRGAEIPSAATAAILQALWDWFGKRLGQPVWRLMGGPPPGKAPPISVTIGIGTPESGVRRVAAWRRIGSFRAWKIKLGSPAGLDADKSLFEAVAEVLPKNALISIDANGGWSLRETLAMSRWLAQRGVEHLEQPLPRGRESELRELRKRCALPILVDESCFTSADIPALQGRVHGINIKLMKCGGISEACRMIHTARACGLRIMLGCYSNSALANTAAAHLGGRVDYLDLDSHLNLRSDPFRGAGLTAGRLILPDSPGFGVTYEPAKQT